MTIFTTLTCPQCGGALPRQAAWRMVECPYCKAVVSRGAQVVERAAFRAALQRSLSRGRDGAEVLQVAGGSYRVLGRLGEGDHAKVLLAESCGALPARVAIKLALSPTASLSREAQVLQQLQALQQPGSAYFSQRLPQFVAYGRTGAADARDALVLRHPVGYWGSLRDALHFHPHGLAEVRHAVWLWRRVLEVLGYVHDAGWTHGDLRAEHWLVHPADHGVLLIGWSRAKQGGDMAQDLMQSAWTMRAALHGPSDVAPPIDPRVPAPLADLLRRASEDATWCAQQGAQQLDQALVAAAREAFGPPQFIPFDPQQA